MDPEDIPVLAVGLTKQELMLRTQHFAKELSLVQHFMKKLTQYMEGIPVLVITTDDQGNILDIYGDKTIKDMTDSLGITYGARFAENTVGTNSVSLALQYHEPIGLKGTDHFHHYLSKVACYSAPLCFSADSSLVGTVSMMTTVNFASHFHLGLLSTAVDTIEREILLQKQNHTLHLLNQVMINSTPMGIVMTNQKGEILEFNTSAEEIMSTTKDNIIYQKSDQLGKIGDYINHVLQTANSVENAEFSIIDGDVSKSLLLDVLPLFDKKQLIGAFAQFRDMTNYHELQQKLIESEKLSAIGKLGAGLAHEIRNPLTSIIGLAQLLKEKPEKSEYLDIITGELERMKGLVNQFVSYGKAANMEREMTDVQKLINETVKLMNNNAHLHHVQIHTKPSVADTHAFIDRTKIKQVLINFIKNAFEAMPEGGKIIIRLTRKNDAFYISIEDEGIGMTKEQLDKLGQPFFTTKEYGLGMGLAICFDMIHSHGGQIEFTSREGQGTTVSIILPVTNHS